jgi:hypothetical protein
MLELMVQVELTREELVRKPLSTVGGSHCYLLGSVLALILASGTLTTAFVATPVALPVSGFSLVAFWAAGIIAILTIVLWPLGLLLL